MGKYIDADLLRKDIDNWKEAMADAVGEYSDGVRFALEHFTFVLDSLQQEQPEVDLNENTMKKEFRMIDSACLLFNYDKLSREQLIARRFYQLGLKARKEE